MNELKGLKSDIRTLVTNPHFRDGSQLTVESEPHLDDLHLGRKVSLEPLQAILKEGEKRYSTKRSESDGWLAPRVHATLRLTRREAADRRLCVYLNVAVFPDHV